MNKKNSFLHCSCKFGLDTSNKKKLFKTMNLYDLGNY